MRCSHPYFSRRPGTSGTASTGEALLEGRDRRTGRRPLGDQAGRPARADSCAGLARASDRGPAKAIATEWNAVGETVDPRAMPLTGLANAAIDRIAPAPESFAAGLAVYGESDLLCYRAAGPAPLVRRQAELWDPILQWAQDRYAVAFEVTAGITHKA